MASWVAERMTQMLVTTSLIGEGDRELYSYGFFMLISRIYYFLVAVVTGLLMDIPLESALFYVVFMVLRTYAGGLHAKTETACTILTTFVLAASVFGIKLMSMTSSHAPFWLTLLIGCIPILLFSPLDNKDKPMTNQEKKHYRVISHVVVFLWLVLALTAKFLVIDMLCYPITFGIFLEGILLCMGRLYNCNE